MVGYDIDIANNQILYGEKEQDIYFWNLSWAYFFSVRDSNYAMCKRVFVYSSFLFVDIRLLYD